jgi:hypothetical protein
VWWLQRILRRKPVVPTTESALESKHIEVVKQKIERIEVALGNLEDEWAVLKREIT